MEFNYEVIVRAVKYPRLEFKGEQLRAIVPPRRGFDVAGFIKKYESWIVRKLAHFQNLKTAYQELDPIKRSQRELEQLINILVTKGSELLNVEPQSISYRRMKRRWGSCSNHGELTFNKHLAHLPDAAVWYVVYHELCHLRYQRHGKRFHALIKQQFPNNKTYDALLSAYWLHKQGSRG
jgi:predicted metal-dependent hydrolase